MSRPRKCERSICLWLLVTIIAPCAAADALSDTTTAAEQLLRQSRDRYSALRSYADTATITSEYRGLAGAVSVERHRFKTRYRAPREFMLQFDEDPKSGADRFVIWCDGGDFNSWWSTTRVHDVYERGRGALAFSLATFPTHGAAVLIPPLIFPKAGLNGPLVVLHEAQLAGTEMLGGRRAHRIIAEARMLYATGRGGEVRKTTLWLDEKTLLVLKVLLDTPHGMGGAVVSRVTIVLDPQADPQLEKSEFRFVVPET